MNISSAYVFGKQISPGEVPIAANVIFERGRFNMNRMVSGFDLMGNIQSTPKEWGISTGDHAIQGGYLSQYFGTNAILAAYGKLQEDGYSIEQNAITGVGRSRTGSECGIYYYLPISMQSLQTEGYSSLHVTISGNAAGLPNASQNDHGGWGMLRLFYNPNPAQLSALGMGFTSSGGDGIETETEETGSFSFSSYDLEQVPTYVAISCGGGTTRFKKIWFE